MKMHNKGFGGGGAIGVGIAVVITVVTLAIVEALLGNVTFSSGLVNTIKPYVVPVGFLGLLALAAKMARGRM